MRYEASFTVTFSAPSDAEACAIASQHHEQLRDVLRVEGADHPYDITLDRLDAGGRDILETARQKPI
jgi:hypothetical protein